MNILGIEEAKHYCRGFKTTAGLSTGSQTTYVENALKGVTSLKEGTPDFDSYRDCALRETERCLFLAISKYRRALDLMIPGASSWAHVTLYYSSFFAAHALLGMFGGWVSKNAKVVVEVAASTPGTQEFLVHRRISSTYSGQHQKFWDIFYGTVPPLMPWLDPTLRFAITPVSSKVEWQSETRNEVNYDSFAALQLALNFQSTFKLNKFPACLPGPLSTQFSISEGLLLITSKFASEFDLSTDALNSLRPKSKRSAKIRRLIFRVRPPRIIDKAKFKSFLI